MALNDYQRQIYQRQLILPELGEAGQEKLLAASVLVCGCGGLGSPVLLYLAALGLGRLGLLDGDVVSPSNLNRQILYTPADVGRSKAEQAAARLRQLNPDLRLDVLNQYLTAENARELVGSYDIAVDCLDNFPARLLLNDACLAENKPFIHAGVSRLSGQTMTVIPGRTPCLRCLFPEGAAAMDDEGPVGVIGATAAVLAALQVTEVYKYVLGLPVNQNLLLYDGLALKTDSLRLAPDPNCMCQKLHRS